MELSPEFNDQLIRVKLEPPDTACLPEQEMTAGTCHIKEELLDDSSDEHSIIEVETEPYNIAILTGRDQIGQSHNSTLQDATAISLMHHVKDEPTNSCDPVSSASLKHLIVTEDQVGEKWLECDLSSATFNQSESAKNHMLRHTDNMLCKSDPRPAESSKSSHLQVHEKTHTDATTNTHMLHLKDDPTDRCDPASSASLKHPVAMKDQVGEQRLECNPSSATSSQSESAKNHMQKHTDNILYKSDPCPAEFRQSSHLQQHKKTHTSKKLYKCDICSADFIWSAYLQHHKKTHMGKTLYKCDLCPAEFSHSLHLQHHKKTHACEKPYKCNICPAAYSHSKSLQCHKKTHMGEDLYKCNLCSADFRQSLHLQHHKKTHVGEKLYGCDLCPRKFIQLHHLTGHIRIHTPEKLYKCNLCPAEFSQSWYLERHEKTHTDEKPYK
ncbi:zinc finger protein OZF-like isoform X3 [Ornithodoros turicata]|uniref:zinc finger protein OZF-like isoform X3 n=1 Tax=Ornithodoros turicata TaxID=34597 RepID=UPI003138C1BB